MTVTYLYCFDLNCLEKKRLKNTHTRIQACTCISLNNLLILQEKPRKHFYLGYISKMPRQQQAVPSTFLESFTSLIKSLSKLRYVKQELQWVQLHPSSHTSFFSKHKKKGVQTHYSSLYNADLKWFNLCHHHTAWRLKTKAVLRQTASAVQLETGTGCQHLTKLNTKNNTIIVPRPPLTNNTIPTWMHVSLVKYYRFLPGHHCESASLSPALSLSLYSTLFSPLLFSQPKQGLRIAVN